MNPSSLPKHLALLCLVAVTGCAVAPKHDDTEVADAGKLVILVSIDGMRADYLDRGVTPNLSALAASGVRAEGMRPSFPSSTFPNHYTLVTGLRPDHHGIVGNTIEDRSIPGVRFKLDYYPAVSDRRWWDEAEPIWVTAEKHGVRAGTMFWPGSEAAIQGVRPSLWVRYDEHVPATRRVDTVLHWLDDRSADRLRFVTLYFDDVDTAGHHDGPDSPQLASAMARVDRAIGELEEGLAKRRLHPDIVVVSDHGMTSQSADRVVRIDQIAPKGSYRWVYGGAYAGIEVEGSGEPALAAALLAPHDHVACWRKADIPERLHYGHNARVPAFFCLADLGWTLSNGPPDGKRPNRGGHGYDNALVDMRATFVAAGPDFKAGTTIPTFDNVDVYPLVMRLLDLAPLPNDGTLATFAGVLR